MTRTMRTVLAVCALTATATWAMAQTPPPAPAAAPPVAAPAPVSPPVEATPSKTAPPPEASAGEPVFPTAIDEKYTKEKPAKARMHTCRDQFAANKATNANGGLKWIQKGGGYYAACSKALKSAPAP